MAEDDKPKGLSGDHHHHTPPQPQPFPASQYGTFQGVSNYTPPRPDPHTAIGFPHFVPSLGAADPSAPPPPYYPHCYKAVPGYAIAEGIPVRECRVGWGWCLFILGFFLVAIPPWDFSLAAIPWGFAYAAMPWCGGTILFIRTPRVHYLEKHGYYACMVGTVLATIVVVLGVTIAAYVSS